MLGSAEELENDLVVLSTVLTTPKEEECLCGDYS